MIKTILNSINNFFLDNQWTHDRRFMNQHFTPRLVKTYSYSFSSCAVLLVKSISEEYLIGRDFNLLPHLERCSVQGVCTTLFGMDLKDVRIDDIYAKTSVIVES